MQKFLQKTLFCLLLISYSWAAQAETSALDTFNAGVTAHKSKKYNDALKYYTRVIASESGLKPVAVYYAAGIYIETGREDEASRLIKSIDISSLPKNLKARIMSLDLPETKNQKHSFEFDIAAGANSNAQFISVDDNNREEEFEAQYVYNLAYEYSINYNPKSDFSIGLSHAGKEYSESDDSKYSTTALELPYHFYEQKNKYTAKASASKQSYSGEDFADVGSLDLELDRKIGVSYLALGYEYDRISINNETYFYLDGDVHLGYLKYKSNLGLYSSMLKYEFQDHNYEDSVTVSPSYDAHKLSFYLYRNKTESNWSLGLIHEYRTYSYDIPEDDVREDNKSSVYGYYGFLINKKSTLYLDSKYTVNNSNFDQSTSDDKNYNQFYLNLGFNYKI